jgi:hypothetical protein
MASLFSVKCMEADGKLIMSKSSDSDVLVFCVLLCNMYYHLFMISHVYYFQQDYRVTTGWN